MESLKDVNPQTPEGWLRKWKTIELRPDWKIVERKANGFLFRGTYMDMVYDDDTGEMRDESPLIAVLATVDHYNGGKWVNITYTVTDPVAGLRAPTPQEAGLVRSLFAGPGAKIAPPKGIVPPYMPPVARNYWIEVGRPT